MRCLTRIKILGKPKTKAFEILRETNIDEAFLFIMENEIWKNIQGYEGYYQISNLGRVKSLERLSKNHSNFTKKLKCKILSNCISKTGYYVNVLYKNPIKKTFKNHRLIAIHFIENPNNYDYINHIDGNKLNNAINNLEWCTIKQNNAHARMTGLSNISGINNCNSNLTIEDVLFIRSGQEGISDLARRYNLNRTTIWKIKTNKRYKEI